MALLPREMVLSTSQYQVPMDGEVVLLVVSEIQDGVHVFRLVGVGDTGGESLILPLQAVGVVVGAMTLLGETVTSTELVNRTDALLPREGSLHRTVVVARVEGVADVHRLIPGHEARQDEGVRVTTD